MPQIVIYLYDPKEDPKQKFTLYRYILSVPIQPRNTLQLVWKPKGLILLTYILPSIILPKFLKHFLFRHEDRFNFTHLSSKIKVKLNFIKFILLRQWLFKLFEIKMSYELMNIAHALNKFNDIYSFSLINNYTFLQYNLNLFLALS